MRKASEGTTVALPIDGEKAKTLAKWIDRPVIMGIRSEDLEIAPTAKGNVVDGILRATVEIAEPMGAETHLYLTSGGERLAARILGQIEAEPQAKLDLRANLEHACYFESVDPAPYHKANGELDLDRWHSACRLIV